MVEEIVGHTGYLSGAYRRYSVDQLKKEYDKAYYAISLHSAENLPEIKAEREAMQNTQQYIMSELAKKSAEIERLQKSDEMRYKLLEKMVEEKLREKGVLK